MKSRRRRQAYRPPPMQTVKPDVRLSSTVEFGDGHGGGRVQRHWNETVMSGLGRLLQLQTDANDGI